MTNAKERLLDFFSRQHYLPSFNLPIDAVPFIARAMEGGDEQILAKMSDGLEKALTGYAPGRELTYKKRDFVVGGIYLEYPPQIQREDGDSDEDFARKKMFGVLNRTRNWFDLDGNVLYFHMCRECKHTLSCTEEPPEIIEQLGQRCEVCNEKSWISLPLIRPPGFAPLIRQSEQTPNFAEVDDPTYSTETNKFYQKTRWPSSLIVDDTESIETHSLVEEKLRISFLPGTEILDVNAGIGSLEEKESDQVGFAFCKDCGNLSPRRLNIEHFRPYAVVASDANFTGINRFDNLKDQFRQARTRKCDASGGESMRIGSFNRILLGRKFKTNVLSLKIKWQEGWIDIDKENRHIAKRGAQSICQAFLQSITNSKNTGLAISSNDLGGDIRQSIDESGFEIFIYERVDGGAGLLKDVYKHIVSEWKDASNVGAIFSELEDILGGQKCVREEYGFSDGIMRKIWQPCEHICSGCLQDFTTQHISGELDRESGHELWKMTLFDSKYSKLNSTQAAKQLISLAEEVLTENKLNKSDLERLIDNSFMEGGILVGESELKPSDKAHFHSVKGFRYQGKEYTVAPNIVPGDNSFARHQILDDPITTKQELNTILSSSKISNELDNLGDELFG